LSGLDLLWDEESNNVYARRGDKNRSRPIAHVHAEYPLAHIDLYKVHVIDGWAVTSETQDKHRSALIGAIMKTGPTTSDEGYFMSDDPFD